MDKVSAEKLKLSEELIADQAAKLKKQDEELAAFKAVLAKQKGEAKESKLPPSFKHENDVYEFKAKEFNFVKENGKVVKMTAAEAIKDKAVISRLIKVEYSGLVKVG